jgi:hypothetical protein
MGTAMQEDDRPLRSIHQILTEPCKVQAAICLIPVTVFTDFKSQVLADASMITPCWRRNVHVIAFQLLAQESQSNTQCTSASTGLDTITPVLSDGRAVISEQKALSSLAVFRAASNRQVFMIQGLVIAICTSTVRTTGSTHGFPSSVL